ncbi:hypothetical protein ACJJTC_004822 [Scirpophaga incertulas]
MIHRITLRALIPRERFIIYLVISHIQILSFFSSALKHVRHFRITSKMLQFLLLLPVAFASQIPCTIIQSLDITDGVLQLNGSVIFDGLEFKSNAWFETQSDGVTVRRGCPCIGRECLWKCCPKEQWLVGRDCVDTDMPVVNPFSPTLYKGVDKTSVQAHTRFYYMHNRLCDDRYIVDTNIPNEELYIQENGTLYEITAGRRQWHAPTLYCVDMMVEENSTESRMIAAVCYPESTDDSDALYIAYAVGMLLSVPFLLATFLVYAFIPELRNLHGMCLMAYCAGLVVAYVFLAYLKLQSRQVGHAMTGCLVIAFIIYYAFQSSFFWLNVMCFDIWRTFSGYRGGSSNKRREQRRFMLYGAYAWGVPLLLSSCTIAMHFADLPLEIIKPGFGLMRCWFDGWLSELVYFFSPVLVLVVCNVVLFSVTSYRIRSIRQETAILKGSESARSDRLQKDKQRYGLYLKLFVVMGVNWTVELVSFAVGGSNWYWILVDLSNVALGFFIFIIFVWKKKVRNMAVKRFRTMFGLPITTPDMRKSPWTSSTHTEDTRISASDDPSFRLKEMR